MTHRLRPMLVCVLLAATICVQGRADSTRPAPNSATLDLPGYLAALDQCSAAAARLKDHPGEAAALKRSLPETWSVMADGQRFDVSTEWLRHRLDAFPVDAVQATERSRQVLTRLRAMRESAAELAGTGRSGDRTADSAFAKRRLDTILKRREFAQNLERGPLRLWWDRTVGWIRDTLNRLFGVVGRHSGPGSPVFWVLAIALGLALVGWLSQSIRRVARTPARATAHSTATAAGWREWAAKAAACARRNEFREAIHLAYRAALYRLEEAGLWQVDDARTPREYLRLLPKGHGQYPPLEALTFRFERSWYGGRAALADDFQLVMAELEDLGCLLDWNPATASS
jgi:hypothetical protein